MLVRILFSQFLEQRLAPSDTPELEVCFFNESIDAKLMRSAKTKFFSKHATPLLTTGMMPPGGYGGLLVPGTRGGGWNPRRATHTIRSSDM